jgi:serine/threonine protein phosphatase 1
MGRHIVIGDIHGCFGELQELLKSVGAGDDDVIVSVGDLVDRGPESVEVLEFFRDQPNAVAVAGNHERKHVRGLFSYSQDITRLQFGDRYPQAVQWMASLPYYLELEHAIVVHAAVVPGLSLSQQKEHILCGTVSGEKELKGLLDGRSWHELWDGDKPVIFGHHVVEQPLIRPGLIYGIDTGACHGHALTAVTLPELQIHAVRAREDHWTHIKRRWQADALAARSWQQMAWPQLDDQLTHYRKIDEPRTSAYMRSLEVWREALDAQLTDLFEAIQREAERLTDEAGLSGRAALAKVHPLSRLLFQSFGGRLDAEALRRQVPTPQKLGELAATVGLDPVAPPAPPGPHPSS